MNAYDLHSILHAKHAQHVVLIHFPIALFLTGVGLDLLSQWLRDESLRVAARLNLILAALSTVPVLITGVIAWRWALEGQRLKGVLLQHLIMAVASSVMIWTIGYIQFLSRERSATRLPRLRLAIELVAAMLIGLTAHLGGYLSGVNM